MLRGCDNPQHFPRGSRSDKNSTHTLCHRELRERKTQNEPAAPCQILGRFPRYAGRSGEDLSRGCNSPLAFVGTAILARHAAERMAVAGGRTPMEGKSESLGPDRDDHHGRNI